MAQSDAERSGLGKIRVAIALLVFELATVLVLGPVGYLKWVIGWDHWLMVTQMGPATTDAIEGGADRVFDRAFVATGAMRWSLGLFDNAVWAPRIEAFWLMVNMVLYRAAGAAVWLPFIAPMLVGVLVDGWTMREVAKYRFSFQSPVGRAWGIRAAKLSAAGIVVIPFLPVPVPPLLYPAGMATAGAGVWFWLRYTQKRI